MNVHVRMCPHCMHKHERIEELEAVVAELLGEPMVCVAGLPPSAMRVAHLLSARGVATRHAVLLAGCNGDMRRVDRLESGSKMPDIWVHQLRRALAPYGIVIETVWGRGFAMPRESRERFKALVAEQRRKMGLAA
ncbi:MAG TPA: helix-turn-helix domain-containing protein [Hyphomicrobiaceae bacterium]|nr:helix-turn-helix domain-containing protein [Hyphomicrobiaceae bacterium]